MRHAALLLLLSACAPPRPVEPAPKKVEWVGGGGFSLTPKQWREAVLLTANDCPTPTRAYLEISSETQTRIVELPPEPYRDMIIGELTWADVWMDDEACTLSATYSVRATLECDVGTRLTTEPTEITIETGLTPRTAHVPSRTRFYQRLTDAVASTKVWRQDELTFAPHPTARLVTNGAAHTFLTAGCDVFCPPARVMNQDFNTELVLALPNDQSEPFRIAVPGRIIDLAFSEQKLMVLSEQGGVVLLSGYPEAMLVMNDKTLQAPAQILPYARAHGFFMQADKTLIAMVSKADGTLVTYTPKAMGMEVNTTPCPGGANVPVPYPGVGGGGGSPSTGSSSSGGVVSSTTSGSAYPIMASPPVMVEGTSCVKPLSISASASFSSSDGMTPVTFTGAFRAGLGVTALLYAGADGTHAMRLDDGSAEKWLQFPLGWPVIRGAAFSADGTKLFVATTRGFHVFGSNGDWLSGVPRLPVACGGEINGRFEGADLVVELGDSGFTSAP